ncbi:hypothetical protein CEE37_09735 [candidate division LCP-89 bacterium B3_LCP]|uniref:Sulfatase N-terminal domain-containing protein n=1 Tax=candidate division LCP-89 bacterium B3_LCP TaxID=2012998 RepID=A0A532UZ32_UNCL8|nr:MAG: hypothetical protein CEE37_09735 [candidate division LCP-89 bacterium B3_LCP]
MSDTSRTRLKDLPLSILLGIGFCSLLGFLLGLRILNWNPDLTTNLQSTFFLLLSTSYLYAILGLIVGILFWVLFFILSRILGKDFAGRKFVKPWIVLYCVLSGLIFIYLALTRQDLRSGNFDNFILIGYYLSIIAFGWLLIRSLQPKTHLTGNRRRNVTLPKFFGITALYFVVIFSYTLFTASVSDSDVDYGDPEEIKASMKNVNDDMRIAIVGWDGAEWSIVQDLLAKGDLPNLRSLIEEGVSAPFKSLPSTKSPLVWTSIATGKLPSKHGIEDFGSFQFPGMVNNFAEYPDGLGLYRLISRFMSQADLPVTSTTRRCKAIWNILSEANLSVGLIGYWASWPAEAVNGFVVSDRFTYTLFNPRSSIKSLKQGQTYPSELLNELSAFCRLPDSITDEERSRFMPATGGKQAYPDDWDEDQYEDWNPLYQFELAYTAAESYRGAGLYLYQKYRPAFFTVYFQAVDMISHFFWQYHRPDEFVSVPENDVARFGNVLPETYRYMDEILGEFLNVLEPGTDVLILSDHGFGFDLNPRVSFRTGEHRLHGIFVASGPHFQNGLELDEINVLDITPTLLHLYGLPVAEDMDGQVLTDVIDADFLDIYPPQQIKTYETGRRVSSITRSDADAQVREQIRALGYVN